MKKFLLSIFVFFTFIFGLNYVNADASLNQYVNPIGTQFSSTSTGDSQQDIQNVVAGIANSVIGKILGIVGLLVLAMFIFAGVLYISAAGKGDKIKKANEIMKWSVIGLMFVFFSYVFIMFFFSTLSNFNGR